MKTSPTLFAELSADDQYEAHLDAAVEQATTLLGKDAVACDDYLEVSTLLTGTCTCGWDADSHQQISEEDHE